MPAVGAPTVEPAQGVDERTVDATVRHAHGRGMGDLARLRPPGRVPRRELLTDERGVSLRVTRHLERGLVVASIWRDDTCVGTFRMRRAEVARLAAFLSAHLADDLEEDAADPPSSRLSS